MVLLASNKAAIAVPLEPETRCRYGWSSTKRVQQIDPQNTLLDLSMLTKMYLKNAKMQNIHSA